ncbi:Cytochrome P450 4V2 [Halotydeus destructor]|nr:Cytochrome P450 4V2 [Halotydeus destructor]
MFAVYFAPLFVLVFILYPLAKWLNKVRRVRKIPGPPLNPLLGHFQYVLAKIRSGCYVDEAVILATKDLALSDEFKDQPIFNLFLGPLANVVATTPEGAEAILTSTTLIDKAMQYNFLHSWLGTGLLTSAGDKWRSRRKMLTPSFHFRILEDFLPTMTRNISILTTLLHEKSLTNPDHVIADISEQILLCALDSICETAMGVSVKAQSKPDNEYVQSIHVAGQAFMTRYINPFLVMDAIFNLTAMGRKYKKSLKVMHDFTKATIRMRKERIECEIKANIFKEEKCMTFLDTLICEHLKNGGSLTTENIQEEVDTFMFEGHDTTAWAVTWCTYLIGLDKIVQEKLHEELDLVFGDERDGHFTMEDLRRLNYTDRCLNEALRLFPSVPLFGRKTLVDTELCGYTIPAGIQIGVVPYIIHRNERHWPEPEVFDPDRFLPEASRSRHPFAYIPFSAGPRNCVGRKFALLEAKSMIANIFRTFKVTSLLPRDKVRISPSLILRSHLPIPVKLEKPAILAMKDLALSDEFKDRPMFSVFVGHRASIAVTTPEGAEAVLSSNTLIDKARPYKFLHSWLGTGLLTSTGDKWKSRRKMLTTSFHFRILDDFLPIMTRNISIFTALLQEKALANPDHVIADVSEPILLCALDSICAQSKPDNEYVQSIHVAGETFFNRLVNPFLDADAIFNLTSMGRKYRKSLKVMHDFTETTIRERKERIEYEMKENIFKEEKCMTFMDTLICQHLKDGGSFTMKNIQEEVDTFMFEGHDTTAWAVTWCTYLIGLDESVQEKLHQELDDVFSDEKDGHFTMEDLRRLNYTERCVSEALRLFPSVPLFGRQTLVDTDLCGYTIPAGTQVGVLSYIIHRNERHWPEPEVFDPDRFLPEASRSRHPFAYIPFSAGPRNCVGRKFALLEAKSMVASLFRTFKVTSLLPRDNVRISPALIIRSHLPLSVKLEKRVRVYTSC